MARLSYKYRIPLSLVISALLTSWALGLAISVETYRNVVHDRITEGTRLIHALSPVLTQALKHDDIWLAYSLLRGPEPHHGRLDEHNGNTLIVIDADGTIFASSAPRHFHTGDPIGAYADLYRDLFSRSRKTTGATPLRARIDDQLVLASGLYSEGAFRGALLVIYPIRTFWNRFREIIFSGAWVMLLVLIPVVILGWYWGRRMVTPLLQLSRCMAQMRTGRVEQLQCPIHQGDDEIGELGAQFQRMLAGLKEKQLLEQQMLAQERLAAIGRLTASVAHEINNPVGGMLMALDNWRRKPEDERDTDKLLGLIERGLNQIRETVSALLVESRIENRLLEPDDIEDIRTLLSSQTLPPGARLQWSSTLDRRIELPASAVRQIILNLASNAMQAITTGQHVAISIALEGDRLLLAVSDDGEPIPPERRAHLFEPFQSSRKGGTGLGLWITYQIVTQLGGAIEVESRPGLTRFSVTLQVSDSATETSPRVT